jgi:hypothetical protein
MASKSLIPVFKLHHEPGFGELKMDINSGRGRKRDSLRCVVLLPRSVPSGWPKRLTTRRERRLTALDKQLKNVAS